jgi:hypothetical protein
VVVEAMDANQQYLNFLRLQGSAVFPDGKTEKLDLVQTEPGRYVAEFPVASPGSHAITVGGVLPDGKTALASTGLSVSYSREFRDTESNRSLLENIASITGGDVVEPEASGSMDFFRRDRPMRSTLFEVWPDLLTLALVLFLLDVAIRRIRVQLADFAPVFHWIRQRFRAKELVTVSTPAMQRLQGRKREVGEIFAGMQEQESKRQPATGGSVLTSSNPKESVTASSTPATTTMAPKPEAPPDANDYTSRLLAAKRNVKHERK